MDAESLWYRLAAMGTTFAFTESTVANIREKNDAVNGAAGGCAAGFLAGLKSASPKIRFSAPLSDHMTLKLDLFPRQSRVVRCWVPPLGHSITLDNLQASQVSQRRSDGRSSSNLPLRPLLEQRHDHYFPLEHTEFKINCILLNLHLAAILPIIIKA